MTFPGEAEGFEAARGDDSRWRNEISPGVFLKTWSHRPIRHAASMTCPVWICLGERDVSAPSAAIERFAREARRAELHRYDADHFQPCYDSIRDRIASDQAKWIRAL